MTGLPADYLLLTTHDLTTQDSRSYYALLTISLLTMHDLTTHHSPLTTYYQVTGLLDGLVYHGHDLIARKGEIGKAI